MKGMTKAELAERVHRTPSAISQFESGLKPDAKTLGLIAMALGVPVAFFGMKLTSALLSGDHCNFRSLRSATQRERRRVLSRGTLIREFAFVLESLIDLEKEEVSQFRRDRKSAEDIESFAIEVRRTWGLGLGPIPHLVRLMEKKGILVAFIPEVSHEVDAFSAWHEKRPMVFLLSTKQPTRVRFDAAHELGHLVMHADANPGNPELERQANRFAGAFLIPRESFLMECPRRLDWNQFFELKRRWGVSVQALVRRAYDLGCISDASYRRAYVYLNQTGQREKEDHEPTPEHSFIIPQAIEMLKDDYTLEDLASRIGLTGADLRSILAIEPVMQ
jgi:Zn-dependent peptidase ImmA (M78 family)